MNEFFEVNLDGLVGPTHFFGGLSPGNLASLKSSKTLSYPKKAALQGLKKAFELYKLGIPQLVLPPHPRPYLPFLRTIGFNGNRASIIEKASNQIPEIYYQLCSSSFMWAANMATVSPSQDSEDQKIHFTPANLSSNFHRSIETTFSKNILQKIFSASELFIIHEPIIASFGDEGAANHTRFCNMLGNAGLQLFVYGKKDGNSSTKFPARQDLWSSRLIAKQHNLNLDNTFFVQQNPDSIDFGVFHNDVISVGHRDRFLYHEKAFVESKKVIQQLKNGASNLNFSLQPLEILESELSIQNAVKSYLFNSQIVSNPEGKVFLIAPIQCQQMSALKPVMEKISKSGLIDEVKYFDLEQSMKNGGGPACLRLRVEMNTTQYKAIPSGIKLNESLYQRLKKWINKNYRDSIDMEYLKDPLFYEENLSALEELSLILGLPNLYDEAN